MIAKISDKYGSNHYINPDSIRNIEEASSTISRIYFIDGKCEDVYLDREKLSNEINEQITNFHTNIRNINGLLI